MRYARSIEIAPIAVPILAGALAAWLAFSDGGLSADRPVWVLGVGVAALAGWLVVRDRDHSAGWLPAWPLALAVLTLASLAPIPGVGATILAPWSAWAWRGLGATSMPWTAAPAETLLTLPLLAWAALGGLVGRAVGGAERSNRIFAWIVLVVAAAVALSGAADRLRGARPQVWEAKSFGPFVNRNHAGAFLNLGLAACMLSRSRRHDGAPTLAPPALALAAVVVVGVIGCGSRAAPVALLFGLALAAWRSRAARTLLAVAVAAGAAVAVALPEVARPLLGRFAQGDGRMAHWRVGWKAAIAGLPLGSGAGSYRYAAFAAMTEPAASVHEHAENMPLELLVEFGLPGALLLALAGVAAWRMASRLRVQRHPNDVAATFLFASQSVHALVDFAVLMPAVAFVGMALVGALATRRTDSHDKRRIVWPLATLGLVLLAAWVADRDRPGRQVVNLIRATAPDRRPELLRDGALADTLAKAVAASPGDPDFAWWFAESSQARFERAASGVAAADLAPNVVAVRAIQWQKDGRNDLLDRLRADPAARRHLKPAAVALAECVRRHPASADVLMRHAETAWLVGPPDSALSIATQAARLAPSSDALFQRALRLLTVGGEAAGR